MLRVYKMLLELGPEIAACVSVIEKFDSDLARQARRAYSSSVLNSAEGMDALGGNKRLRYRCALGSWNETIAAVAIAETLGYLAKDAGREDRMQHARASLLNLVRPRQ